MMNSIPPHLLDLTGLPEGVVEQIQRLASDARRVPRPQQPTPTADDPKPTPVSAVPPPRLSPEQWRQALDEMAAMSSGQSLPADWSRADLYEDHD
jgi:hypothetical protein